MSFPHWLLRTHTFQKREYKLDLLKKMRFGFPRVKIDLIKLFRFPTTALELIKELPMATLVTPTALDRTPLVYMPSMRSLVAPMV